MNRYMVFWGDDYYPDGGYWDAKAAFDDISKALSFANQNKNWFNWCHIVDLQAGNKGDIVIKNADSARSYGDLWFHKKMGGHWEVIDEKDIV